MRKLILLFLFLFLSFSSLYSATNYFNYNTPLCNCIRAHCVYSNNCKALTLNKISSWSGKTYPQCKVENFGNITNLDCSNSGDGYGITKLDGIHKLNSLSTLNVGSNTKISSLYPVIYLNNLVSLHANNTSITAVPVLPGNVTILNLSANESLSNLSNLNKVDNSRIRSINFNGNSSIEAINDIVAMEQKSYNNKTKRGSDGTILGRSLVYLDLDDIYAFHEDNWDKIYSGLYSARSHNDDNAEHMFLLKSWLEKYENVSYFIDEKLDTGLIYDTGLVNKSTKTLITKNMTYWKNEAKKVATPYNFNFDLILLREPFLKKLKNKVIGYTAGKRRNKCAEFGSINNYATLLAYTATHPKYASLKNILLANYRYKALINEIIVSFKSFIRNIDPISQRPSDFRVSPSFYLTVAVKNLLVELSDTCVLDKFIVEKFKERGIVNYEDFLGYLFDIDGLVKAVEVLPSLDKPEFYFEATRYFNDLRELREEYENAR